MDGEFHVNTLMEHMREVKGDIQRQRTLIEQMEIRMHASAISAATSIVILACLGVFASSPAWILFSMAGLTLIACCKVSSSIRDLNTTRILLTQNEFYYSTLVEEVFSGKDFSPKFN